jgi:ABC-type polysaccharide/polyol phosphate transport system ATPase subunit
MGVPAVEVQQVSKTFRLFHERHASLKDRVVHPGRSTYTNLVALDDIDFTVGAGETIGIIGRNGSGKSTLLKCICGVLQPTSGRVLVRGALSGLLELGAGFQIELSGRDNVYLNGAMLGLTRKDVDRVFDDIVAFSELDQFIDTQVKFYSSGMYVRLGFAVAVNVDPDVLVIDEVLAVGDEKFQGKCLERILSFQEEGRTILFVSHNADQVRTICDRAIVLDGGKMLTDATPGEAVRVFREHLGDGADTDELGAPNRQFRAVKNVDILGVDVVGGASLHTGDPLRLRVGVKTSTPVVAGLVIELHRLNGQLIFRTDPDAPDATVEVPSKECVLTVDLGKLPVLDGAYQLNVGLVGRHGTSIFDWKECAASIDVTYEGRARGALAMTPKVAVEPRPDDDEDDD